MNKKILILFTTVFFILFTNLFLIKSSAHKKMHDNHILFTGIHGHSVRFIVKRHCISPGQPYGTPDGSQAGSVKQWRVLGTIFGINIRAGRHGTKKTVNCVIANLLGKNASFQTNFTFNKYPYSNTLPKNPKKLNFAVKGTLVIKGKYFDNIILAQGHAGARNNWWFGGNDCSIFPSIKEQVNCTARDGTKWCFVRGKNTSRIDLTGANHVKVEANICSKSSS